MQESLGAAKAGQRSISRLRVPEIVPGILAVLAAAPLAVLVSLVNSAWPDQPEKAVVVVGALFAVVLAVPVTAYLLITRRLARPATLSLIVLATAGILLIAIYFYRISFFLLFPADFLIWSETEFVNDILKLRVGYPIYTAHVNNESFIYPPGTPVLTYLIALIFGQEDSIPFFRMIQIGYGFAAAIFAYLALRGLLRLRYQDEAENPASIGTEPRNLLPWSVVWLPLLFLIATNSISNPYAHNLHNDALGQLVAAIAFFLLVKYASTRDSRLLIPAAIIPAAGFLVKQIISIWAPLFLIYLVVFDRPRSITRIAIFSIAAFGGISLSVLAGQLIWGEHFIYWLFTAAGNHDVSPLRSFQHILDIWPYIAIGLVGGFILLKDQKLFSPVTGLWAVWLALVIGEAYTSGIGWMLNHLGPGSLIAGVWFAAGLTRLWKADLPGSISSLTPQKWLGYGIAAALLLLLFNGLGLFRIPIRPLSDDSTRYVQEIEKEFEGLPADRVLLDSGTWLYFDDNVVMKDRVTSIGDRGRGQTGDFSGIVQRLDNRHYSKILVRGLHSPDFWYDYYDWPQSSGIKQALLENYDEVRVIEGIEGDTRYLFGDISVLVPKS